MKEGGLRFYEMERLPLLGVLFRQEQLLNDNQIKAFLPKKSQIRFLCYTCYIKESFTTENLQHTYLLSFFYTQFFMRNRKIFYIIWIWKWYSYSHTFTRSWNTWSIKRTSYLRCFYTTRKWNCWSICVMESLIKKIPKWRW